MSRRIGFRVRWTKVRPSIALAAILGVLGLSAALAQSSGPQFDPSYPGFRPDDGTAVAVDVAFSAVQSGVQAYYRIHGSWPATWSQVVQEGIYQAPLPAFQGGTIDPDDSSLDFLGDLHYISGDGTGSPQVLRSGDSSRGGNVFSTPLEGPFTYEALISTPGPAGLLEEYSPYLADTGMMSLFGIIHCAADGLDLYRTVYGELPDDWNAFCQSGLSPTGTSGRNPATGKAILGDGSAGDIYYEKVAPDRFKLHHVNRDGTDPHWMLPY